MNTNESKLLIDEVKNIVTQLKDINDKLNYLCTQGMFIKIDEDVSEN